MAAKTTANAYHEAMARLRRFHDDEFHILLAEIYEEWDLPVQKRRSRQQAKQHRIEQAKAIIANGG